MADAALDEGRTAFAARSWDLAFERLSIADEDTAMQADDLELLAESAFLTGHEDASDAVWARAYQAHVSGEDVVGAARSAYWLAFHLVNRGELARAAGWAGRATRLLEEDDVDCVERGHLMMLRAIQTLWSGDAEAALAIIAEATEIARRFGNADLFVLTSLARGQALITMGRSHDGLAVLDELMVSVTTGEVSATVSGLAYCAVISTCHEMFDLKRAQEWTAALSHWCDAQPGLVPYTGWCQVHRAEIMQVHGAWEDACDTAFVAVERSLLSHDLATGGAAQALLGDLCRLRGDLVGAEDAYREATRLGHEAQPGIALLRLAQGQGEQAAQSIRRILDEQEAPSVFQAPVLAAAAEILLAVDDLEAARGAAQRLSELAAGYESPLLDASAAQCVGAVLLADDHPKEALGELRRAWRGWKAVDAPYESARTRVLLARACRLLDDEDSALMELDAARWTFRGLGATPDVAAVDAMSRPQPTSRADVGLTEREVEVLRLVAAGKTNRAVAADLVLSEKTVARHLSNIYTKLDLPSRAAATAFAYEHDLI